MWLISTLRRKPRVFVNSYPTGIIAPYLPLKLLNLVGTPAPFSLKARGNRQILIYSNTTGDPTDPKDPNYNRLTTLRSHIELLAKQRKFDIALTIPHDRNLGNVSSQATAFAYDQFTVQQAGSDRIRVSADSAPDCDVWEQFLRDLRTLAWGVRQTSPVDRVFYLNASDVASAINGTGSQGQQGGAQGGGAPNITVNAVGAQTSGLTNTHNPSGANTDGSAMSTKGTGNAGDQRASASTTAPSKLPKVNSDSKTASAKGGTGQGKETGMKGGGASSVGDVDASAENGSATSGGGEAANNSGNPNAGGGSPKATVANNPAPTRINSPVEACSHQRPTRSFSPTPGRVTMTPSRKAANCVAPRSTQAGDGG